MKEQSNGNSEKDAGTEIYKLQLCISQLIFLAGIVMFFLGRYSQFFPESWTDSLIVLGIIALIFSGVTFLTRNSPWRFLPLIAKLIVICIIGFPLGSVYKVELLLLISWITEAYAYFIPKIATALSASAVIAVLLLQTEARIWETISQRMDLDSLFLMAAVSFLAIALNYYSCTKESQSKRTQQICNRLNEAALEFIDINTTLQEQLVEAEKNISEAERQRIADEIHDQLGYAMVNVKMLSEAAIHAGEKNSQEFRDLLYDIRSQAEEALAVVRKELREIRIRSSRQTMLVEALVRLQKAFAHTHMQISVDYGDIPISISPQIDEIIYRLVQESIANAIRHGGADRIDIRLQKSGDAITLVVRDNGKGSKSPGSGIGLKSMSKRLELVNGWFTAQNTLDGFAVNAWIPTGKSDGTDQNSNNR